MTGRGFRSLAWLIGGRLFAAVAQAVLLLVLARSTTPVDFGIGVGVYTSLAAIAWITGFGFAPYLTLERAKDRSSLIVGSIIRLNYRLGFIAALVSALSLLVLSTFNQTFLLLLPLCIAVWGQRDASVWNALAVADKKELLFSTNLCLRRAVALLAFVTLYLFGIAPLLAFSAAAAAAELASNARLKASLRSTVELNHTIGFSDLLQGSRSLWADTISGQIRSFDVALVGLVSGATTAGLYAVPSRLTSPLLLLPTSIATLLLPRVSSGGHRSRRRLVGGVVVVMFALAVVLLLLAFFMESVILVALGTDYLSAAAVAQIYLIGIWSVSGVVMLNAVLQGLGHAKFVARISTVGALATVAGVLVGAGVAQATGAAFGYSLSVTIQLLVVIATLVWLVRKK